MYPQYLTMGIDIGSAASKAVIMRGGRELLAHALAPFGSGTRGPEKAMAQVLAEAGVTMEEIDYVLATGYGRGRVSSAKEAKSELSCHAVGAAFLCPGVRTVVDIGGQDTKALQLGSTGILENFVMNDKCAAGTGRFLEVMARVLDVPMEELAVLDAQSENPEEISSTCTVFAESEVVSLLADGAETADVVRGIHNSIAGRTAGLAARLRILEPVFLSGGLSRDAGLVRALERSLECRVLTSELSPWAGAIGAAILGYRSAVRQKL